MYALIKPFLFRFSAEKAHHMTTSALTTLMKVPLVNSLFVAPYRYENESLKREVFGLTFPNPVGLAAGFDKDGKYIEAMARLGFGFIEVGTVTPLPQAGNPQPRLFRLKADRAIINRMGFNNGGVDALVSNLKKLKKERNYILGGNIGKNKVTPNDRAHEDYRICFEKLYDHVDYFVVNLSSPNTPGLRELQDKGPLRKILSGLIDHRAQQAIRRPILLKIAPDLTDGQINDVIEIVQELGIDGLIATNTTIAREPLTTDAQTVESIGAGGLSGAPLADRATEVVSYIHKKSNGAIPIIGVGGIDSAQSAMDKVNAGAALVQVYSGMIYEGPSLIKAIKKALA